MSTAIEKSWPAVPPQLLTVDGTSLGVIVVANSSGFKVKQQIVVVATGQPDIIVKILRFTSKTSFYVGPVNPKAGGGNTRVDLSLYTVTAGAYVYAQEQPKVTVKPEDIMQAVYRQEPGTTIGVEIDDQWGNPIDSVIGSDGKNRLAVDTTIQVESIEIGTVDQGNPNTPVNAWPVEVFGPNNHHAIEPNTDGSVNVDISKSIGLFNIPYDSIAVTYPSATVEMYQSYLGGLSGTPVQLVVVIYSNATKNDIISVVRTPTG